MAKEFITLADGSGGKEMQELIDSFKFKNRGDWKNFSDDSATLDIGGGFVLAFTSDSFVVNPLFFPDANIGHLAFCGTVNDLAVMGAKPIGLSLSLVIEEGFSRNDLNKIITSINDLSKKYSVPIVTGDTKVMEKGKIDKLVINTSAVGLCKKDELLTKKIDVGDKIIISGGIGEHAVALLSKRFDYTTSIISDSKPLISEINSVRGLIKFAKDPTRGGIASILNEIAYKNNIELTLFEKNIPSKKEVKKVCEMLGINLYELACEGRFICFCESKNADEVLKKLKKFNKDAKIIGEVTNSFDNIKNKDNEKFKESINQGKVVIETFLGKRILPMPTGRIVPRIC